MCLPPSLPLRPTHLTLASPPQPQGYARVMENVEPHLVEPVVLELGDADSEEHGCPCSLEFHSSTPPQGRDKFTLTPLGR